MSSGIVDSSPVPVSAVFPTNFLLLYQPLTLT